MKSELSISQNIAYTTTKLALKMVLELPPGFEYAIPEHLSGAPSPLEKGLDEAVLAGKRYST